MKRYWYSVTLPIVSDAVDPEIEISFDSYEDMEYDFGKDINPDPNTIETDRCLNNINLFFS